MWLVFAGRGAAGAARRIRDAAPTISLQCVSSTSDLSLDCFSQHMGTCTYTQTVVGDSEEAAVCAGGDACEPHVPTTCSAPRVCIASVCHHLAENQISALEEIVWRFTAGDKPRCHKTQTSPKAQACESLISRFHKHPAMFGTPMMGLFFNRLQLVPGNQQMPWSLNRHIVMWPLPGHPTSTDPRK